jgi:hypothetical protein
MNDDGTGILLIGLAIAGLPAMLVVLTALLPGYVQRARSVMQARPGRSFLIGLANFVFFGVLVLLAEAPFPPVAFLGAFSLLIIVPTLLVVGLLIATGIVGERLWLQIAERSGSLLGSLIIGMATLGVALLVPILGWLLFLGLVLTGLGAAIIALIQRKRPEASPAVVMEE